MNKKIIIILVAFLLLVVGLSGCFESEKKDNNNIDKGSNRFVGTWIRVDDETYIVTFNSNGTCVFGEYIIGNYSYSRTTSKYILSLDVIDNTPGVHPDNRHILTDYECIFSNDYKTLSITNPMAGQGWFLTKQE
jgi:hypothetical protein